MLFLDKDDLNTIFGIIARHYTDEEEVPRYANDFRGIEKLLGVFERTHMSHYPSIVDKVVCLFIEINKGHFFSNGNKRLSLVSAIGFLFFNDKVIKHLSRDEFRLVLLEIFPNCIDCLEDHSDFTPEEFALYNLSIIVADSHKHVTAEEGHEVLKEKLVTFFNKVVEDVT